MYEEALSSGPDEFSYDQIDEQVGTTPDGIREVTVFPYKQKETGEYAGGGNFGLLNIGSGNEGMPVLGEQIINGVAPSDLELEVGTATLAFYDEDGQPVTYDMTGSPGLKSGVEDAVETRVGDVIGFFRHDIISESGSNAVYRLVDMRFGRVMCVDFQSSPDNKRLVIQPLAYTGPGVGVRACASSTHGQVGRLRLVR
jgi:hypothetical protein